MNKKEKAVILRKRGQSLAEIAEILKISKSTASLWLKSIGISKAGRLRLQNRITKARVKGGQVNHVKKLGDIEKITEFSQKLIKNLKFSKIDYKIFCALLYWCEGSKGGNSVRFINSDPYLIKTFLLFLRLGFQISEDKFRVCLHLHKYHKIEEEIKYWSNITAIHGSKFLKIHQKANTGKRLKDNYHGCASIRYYDVSVLNEIKILYKLLFINNGGVIQW